MTPPGYLLFSEKFLLTVLPPDPSLSSLTHALLPAESALENITLLSPPWL